MNTNHFFYPVDGYLHFKTGIANPFPSQTALLCHLNSTSHAFTLHSMVNHSDCAGSGIYSCCTSLCPASPKTYFQAFHDHCAKAHPSPPPPPPAPNISQSNISHNSPLSISTQLLHIYSPPNTNNHWEDGLNFIDSVNHHKPPDFRNT
jgi:hypothetical protein